ncbi:MAG TPA: DNA cytosine methyltransferase, partial [Muribaculaceae bacterium]|nr:DNA cytosine methyltransferase [Muribaculaceae bacterium]
MPEIESMLKTKWYRELDSTPLREYTSVELFAGAGGLALGLEKAGFKHILLNEYDHNACETLRTNRPQWNVVESDIHDLD